jgi:hypothetical protein
MAETTDTTTEEITLESVVAIEPDALTEDQKTFLEENKDQLNEEQSIKYGYKEEPIDPEKIEIETRDGRKVEPAKKSEDKEEEDPDLADMDPEDKKRIDKLIEKRITPVQQQLKQQNDEVEVNTYLLDHPEYGKYKGAILKYVAHPAYAQIPVKNIAAMVAADDMQKLGAQKEREAQKKIAETKNPGSGGKKPSGGTDWRTAPKEDYNAKLVEVMGRRG